MYERMNVLGLKVTGHDTGAALIAKGGVFAIGEERLNRIKHSPNIFPSLSIQYCLDAAGIQASDVDLVVIDRFITRFDEMPKSKELFLETCGKQFTKARVELVNHHDAHAASAFFCSPFEEAAVLVYDGAGDSYPHWFGLTPTETDTIYKGEGNKLFDIQRTMHLKTNKKWPYSTGIGALYTKICFEYLNLGAYNEGKMMGLASYGDDSVLKKFPIDQWVTEYKGTVLCNPFIRWPQGALSKKKQSRNVQQIATMGYYKIRRYIRDSIDSVFRFFQSRNPKIGSHINPNIFAPIKLDKSSRGEKDPLPEPYYAAVAYAMQKVFETAALLFGRKLKVITGSENLCIAGGCGLNIDANRNFIDEVGFKRIFVQPGSSDAGLPLGAALYGYHVILGMPRFWNMQSASLGRAYSGKEVDTALVSYKDLIQWKKIEDVGKTVAELIDKGNIVGWFQGGSEYGPRALGNRSILCDARKEDMKDVLNARVKHREMWRPFATVILRDKMTDWFDIDIDSPFMLIAANGLVGKKEHIPSVIHVDGTSRLQTVTKEHNGRYYELLKAFDDRTGVPLMLNTSFNLGGEPIVETPKDALKTFCSTNMDYLVIEDRLITKK